MSKDHTFQAFLNKYKKFQQNARDGKYGKTAEFWTYYSVQTNNYELRLDGLKKAFPLFFALNKQNYTSYGSIYVNTLSQLDKIFAVCKDLLVKKSLSVQSLRPLSNNETYRSTW